MKRGIFLIAVLCMIVSVNAEVIYKHSFSGDGTETLNGTAPDVDNNGGGNLWASNAGFYTDGTVALNDGGAVLPFEPEAGKIYTLTADITGSPGGDWQEESLLVTGLGREEAMALAVEFAQFAFFELDADALRVVSADGRVLAEVSRITGPAQ